MRYQTIDPTLFVHNRRRFVREMDPNWMAVFHSNDLMPRNGDSFYPFRQNSDFFALSGIDQEECVLILYPDCKKEEYKEILFIRKTSPYLAVWEGKKYNKEEADKISGVKTVLWLDQLEPILQSLLYMSKGVYLNSNENDRFVSSVKSKDHRFALEMNEKYPLIQKKRAQPVLKSMAMIKHPIEVDLIFKACQITGDAFERVCSVVRPGIMEYEIEAEIIHEFIKNGAQGHAYLPIIASGSNSCILHYIKNESKLKEGDVLLLDFGAEYANYAADLSRTIPVNGQFSSRQRQVYQSVLDTFKMAKQLMVPGQNLKDIQREVEVFIGYELFGLGLVSNKSPEKTEISKYFMHGIGHHLGLDVHDLADRYVPLQAGMVLTCEPGIYIREEHLGIRIENDILITDHGPQDLMSEIPIEIEHIESIMNGIQVG